MAKKPPTSSNKGPSKGIGYQGRRMAEAIRQQNNNSTGTSGSTGGEGANDNNNNIDALLSGEGGAVGVQVPAVQVQAQQPVRVAETIPGQPPLLPPKTKTTHSRNEVNVFSREISNNTSVNRGDSALPSRQLRSGKSCTPPIQKKKNQPKYHPNMAVPSVGSKGRTMSSPPATIGRDTAVEQVDELSFMDDFEERTNNEEKTVSEREEVLNDDEIPVTLAQTYDSEAINPGVGDSVAADILPVEIEKKDNADEMMYTLTAESAAYSVSDSLPLAMLAKAAYQNDDEKSSEVLADRNSMENAGMSGEAEERSNMENAGILAGEANERSNMENAGISAISANATHTTEEQECVELEVVFGTALWCACMGLCKISNIPASKKHLCVLCHTPMHVICGYRSENKWLCYDCSYGNQDYARKFIEQNTNSSPSLDDIVVWFENKESSNPATSNQESIDMVDDEEVQIVTNPDWTQNAVLVNELEPRISFVSDNKNTKQQLILLENKIDEYNEYQIEYKYSASIADAQSLKVVLKKLFGKDSDVSLSEIIGMCSFLEKAYLHEFDNPLLAVLDFKAEEEMKKVSINCECLNVMLILLCPQEIEALETIPEKKTKKNTSQNNLEYTYKQLNYKTMSDDSETNKLEVSKGTVSNVTSEYASKHWIAISHKCSLPWMYLTQPLGFYLEKEEKTSIIYVYIYLSLSTDVNCKRLLYNEERMTAIRKSLSNRNESTVAGKGVDGSAVMIHPFCLEELSDQRKENMAKEFDIISPLSNCAPNLKIGEFFANRKYTASLLTSTSSFTNLLSVLFNYSQVEEMFKDVPSADRKNNKKLMYEISVYLNIFEQVSEKYSYFKSRGSFVDLLYDLVEFVGEEVGFQFPSRHHIQNSNIVHITRLMFRFIAPDLGLMFLDGNCRNYSVCLAYSRSTGMNEFLCQQISSNDAQPEPNYEECAKLLLCDYLAHPYSRSAQIHSPYSLVKHRYVEISTFAYKSSTSANVLTCQQYAGRFFDNIVTQVGSYQPHDTQLTWSDNFIRNNYAWHRENKRTKSSPAKQTGKRKREKKAALPEDSEQNEVSWMHYVNDWYLKTKRYVIYNDMYDRNAELFVRNKESSLYTNFFKDKKHERKRYESDLEYEERFFKFCCNSDPMITRTVVFKKVNMLVTMSRYLSLLVCRGKDGIGDLVTTLRILVGTNGVYHSQSLSKDSVLGLRSGLITNESVSNPIINMGIYGGILPTKQEHENFTSYSMFSKAFTALFYSPTILWGTVCSRAIFFLTSFNFREKVLFDRCVYSAYRDVLKLHLVFQGPLIPIPNELQNKQHPYFDFGWLMSLDFFRKHKHAKSHIPKEFHSYDFEKLDGFHLSSNIPNFVMCIGLATLLYEFNEYYYSTEKRQIFPVDENLFILRSNARDLKKLFCLVDEDDDDIIPMPTINDVRNKNYEKQFRKTKRRTAFNNPTEVCYIDSLQMKIAFVQPISSRPKENQIDQTCKWMTIGELAIELFKNKHNPLHDFFGLDRSFLGIVRYLSNADNMLEMMMNPKTMLEKISGKAASAKGKREMITKICQIVGCPEPIGAGSKGKRESIDSVHNRIIPRPKAYCFTANEKKLFKSIFRFRMENHDEDFNPLVHEKNPVLESKMAMLNMANVFAEKMLTCLSIAKMHTIAKPEDCISEKVFKQIDSGVYGRKNVYVDAASKVVNHLYGSHFNYSFNLQYGRLCTEDHLAENLEEGETVCDAHLRKLFENAFQLNPATAFQRKLNMELDEYGKFASMEGDRTTKHTTFTMIEAIEQKVQENTDAGGERNDQGVDPQDQDEADVPDVPLRPEFARQAGRKVRIRATNQVSESGTTNQGDPEPVVAETEQPSHVADEETEHPSHVAAEGELMGDLTRDVNAEELMEATQLLSDTPPPPEEQEELMFTGSTTSQSLGREELSSQSPRPTKKQRLSVAVDGSVAGKNLFPGNLQQVFPELFEKKPKEISATEVILSNEGQVASLSAEFKQNVHQFFEAWHQECTTKDASGVVVINVKLEYKSFVQIPRLVQNIADECKAVSDSTELSHIVFGGIRTQEELCLFVVGSKSSFGTKELLLPRCIFFVMKASDSNELKKYWQLMTKTVPGSSQRVCVTKFHRNQKSHENFIFDESWIEQSHGAIMVIPKENRTKQTSFCGSERQCKFRTLEQIQKPVPCGDEFECRYCRRAMHPECGHFDVKLQSHCLLCDYRLHNEETFGKEVASSPSPQKFSV